MPQVKFDPFRGFEALARKMNDIVSDLDKGVNVEYGGFSPRTDIYEEDSKIYINAELPGVNKEDVKVTVNDENLLVIKGKKNRVAEPEEGKERTFIRAERSYGEFTRSFILPEDVDKDKVEAKYENGVLHMVLTVKEPAKPKEKHINID